MFPDNLGQNSIDRICTEMNEKSYLKQFFDTVSSTLKNCIYIPSYKQHGHDSWLLFRTYDDETIVIGCVENNNYLLDSQFIFQRLRFLNKDSCTLISNDKSAYFSELFNRGVLKPYKRFQRSPLCKLRFRENSTTLCFCIPCCCIDVDISTLTSH